MNGRGAAIVVAMLLGALCIAEGAAAHGRSVSYSVWTFDQANIRVRARISRLELTRLALDPVASARDSERAASLLANRIRLTADGSACAPTAAPTAIPAENGWLVYAWSLE